MVRYMSLLLVHMSLLLVLLVLVVEVYVLVVGVYVLVVSDDFSDLLYYSDRIYSMSYNIIRYRQLYLLQNAVHLLKVPT